MATWKSIASGEFVWREALFSVTGLFSPLAEYSLPAGIAERGGRLPLKAGGPVCMGGALGEGGDAPLSTWRLFLGICGAPQGVSADGAALPSRKHRKETLFVASTPADCVSRGTRATSPTQASASGSLPHHPTAPATKVDPLSQTFLGNQSIALASAG